MGQQEPRKPTTAPISTRREDHACSCHTAWPMRTEPCSVCLAIDCTYFDLRARDVENTFGPDIDILTPDRAMEFKRGVGLGVCPQHREGRYGIHEECEQPSQREEFEHHFGVITDDQWQWLKEFLKRNPVT